MSTDHHKSGPSASGEPIHHDVAFEARDVRTSPILKFLVYLGVVVALSYVLVFGIYRGLKSYWKSTYAPPMPSRMEAGATMPPEPRLQGLPGHLLDPQEDYRLKVKEDRKANEQLEWVDEKAGIAEIPVTDAMKLIVEKGIPAIKAPEEKK